MDVFDRLPGRWVFFDRDFTELHGDWREWQGMRASNLNFLQNFRKFTPIKIVGHQIKIARSV